jgi:hypothetical protein
VEVKRGDVKQIKANIVFFSAGNPRGSKTRLSDIISALESLKLTREEARQTGKTGEFHQRTFFLLFTPSGPHKAICYKSTHPKTATL